MLKQLYIRRLAFIIFVIFIITLSSVYNSKNNRIVAVIDSKNCTISGEIYKLKFGNKFKLYLKNVILEDDKKHIHNVAVIFDSDFDNKVKPVRKTFFSNIRNYHLEYKQSLERGISTVHFKNTYGIQDFISSILSKKYIINKNKGIEYQDKKLLNLFNLGARVRITGKIQSPKVSGNVGQIDFREQYLEQGIYYVIRNPLVKQLIKSNNPINSFRNYLLQIKYFAYKSLLNSIDKNTAEIYSAIILGITPQFDNEINHSFRLAGIGHLMTISGLHILLFAGFIFLILKKILKKEKIAIILSLIIVFIYVIFLDMPISAMRAYIMLFVILLGKLIGRKSYIFNSLAIAVLYTIVVQPMLLMSISFVLSFSCVLALALINPVITNIFSASFFRKSPFNASVSIFIFLLPIYALYFYTAPLYSILLNMLAIPMAPIIILCGIGLIVEEVIGISICNIIPCFSIFIIRLLKSVSDIILSLPTSQIIIGKPENYKIIIYYLVLVIVVVIDRRYKTSYSKLHLNNSKANLKVKFSVFITIILLLNIVFFIVNKHNGLDITMIDVGQGDGILIHYKNKSIFIDGGSTDINDVGENRLLPVLKYNGCKKIDYFILTHPDYDHLSGIYELAGYKEFIKRAFLPYAKDDINLEIFRTYLKNSGIKVEKVCAGQIMVIDKNLRLICMHPPKNYSNKNANEFSTTLVLEYKSFKMLFTGDLEKNGEELFYNNITNNPLTRKLFSKYIENIDILKVGHHGSRYASSDKFLSLVNPRLGIISCGENSRYRHPHMMLLERLDLHGIKHLRTDKDGAIKIKIKNNKALVYSFDKERGYFKARYNLKYIIPLRKNSNKK